MRSEVPGTPELVTYRLYVLAGLAFCCWQGVSFEGEQERRRFSFSLLCHGPESTWILILCSLRLLAAMMSPSRFNIFFAPPPPTHFFLSTEHTVQVVRTLQDLIIC